MDGSTNYVHDEDTVDPSSNLGKIPNDGSPDLLIDLVNRYKVDSRSVQRIMRTIEESDERKREVLQ